MNDDDILTRYTEEINRPRFGEETGVGDWCDRTGCCKVCKGEIPYGHEPACWIHQAQKRIASLERTQIKPELRDQIIKHRECIESGRHLTPYCTCDTWGLLGDILAATGEADG